MKKIFFFLFVYFIAITSFSQYIHKIKADSVLITNDSCNAELNLENSTRSIAGFLYNKGNGRTEFRRGIVKQSDSIWLIGADTLNVNSLVGAGSLFPHDGLTRIGDSVYLGDTLYSSGPHNFTRNRFQYLNGYYYSLGGTVRNADSFPVFRFYDNGDFSAKATMNYTGPYKNGLRFNARMGYLQLGLSDHVDTTVSNMVGPYQTSAIILNTDDENYISGQLKNTFLGTYNLTLPAGKTISNSMLTGGSHYLSQGLDNSIIAGLFNAVHNGSNNVFISGLSNIVAKYDQNSAWFGFNNQSYGVTHSNLTSGFLNKIGAAAQLTVGAYLTNRSHAATALGNANVDFTSLPYNSADSLLTFNVHNIERQALLFSLGNSNAKTGGTKSNALTILYGGRTQINTTGFDVNLSESAVTPKAAFEVVSTNSGILLPKLTTTQRDAISPGDLHDGLLLYNTDSTRFQYYTGTYWKNIADTSVAIAPSLDPDLNDIAALGASNDDILQRKAGAWTNRTPAQFKTDLVLVKGDVGLSNVDNTSDATKNSSTATITNKRITARVGTTTSSSTPTPDADAQDQYTVTALSTNATFAAPSGTPTEGQVLLVRIKDNGTARALSWNSNYRGSIDFSLPSTTVVSKTMFLHFIYNSAESKWDCIGYTNGF